jgi:hypothetical protein
MDDSDSGDAGAAASSSSAGAAGGAGAACVEDAFNEDPMDMASQRDLNEQMVSC